MTKLKKNIKKGTKDIPVVKKNGVVKKYQNLEDEKIKKNLKNSYSINEEYQYTKKQTDSKSDKVKKEIHQTPDKIEDLFSRIWVTYKTKSTPHIKSDVDWVSQLIFEEQNTKPIPLPIRSRLKELAKQIYEDDVIVHKTNREKYNRRGDKQFHPAVFTHGTSKDKIAAYAYKCMEYPVYSVQDLFFLIEFASNIYKASCNEAIENITNLFQTTFLPSDHTAREFESHNFRTLIPLIKTNPEQAEKQLVLWYFESKIQLAYLKFVSNLEKLCYDSVHKTKSLGIKGLQNLVKNHPDQDAETILRKLINKFGDSNSKTASEILYVLRKIQESQPKLKLIIVALTEELLYRSNISNKAQYFCICFLKDMIFKRDDSTLAEKLIKIYFDFFKTCSKSGEVDNCFMGALLRGLSRAYPYVEKKETAFLGEQIETLYKLCHLVNFNIATQTLQLLFQVQNSTEGEISARYYTILYNKLLDFSNENTSMAGAFLNIVFKAIVRDTDKNRVCAFVRRLVQISKYHSSNIVCGILFLISEGIQDNLKFENIRSLMKLSSTGSYILNSKELGDDDDDDDFEYYPDLDDEDSKKENEMEKSNSTDDTSKTDSKSCIKTTKYKTESSWHHRENTKQVLNQNSVRTKKYDPKLRNPLFCGANLSPMWELSSLKRHYHPTVSLFALKLVDDEEFISYKGDPLEDFTLTRFLNRFANRNPKKIERNKDAVAEILGNKSQYKPAGVRGLAVNSVQFKQLKKEKVAPEDMFFYNYFTEYQKQKCIDKKILSEEDNDSVDDDEFDEYMKRMSSLKVPTGEADDEDDSMDFANNTIAVDENEEDDDDDEIDEEDDDEMDSEDEDEDDDEEVFDKPTKGSEGEDDSDLESIEEDYDDDEEDDLEDDDSDGFDGENIYSKLRKNSFKKAGDWRNMLVDADEFSELLEASADDPLVGTSEAMFNKDKASAKQLMWEKKRRHGDDDKGLKSNKGKAFTNKKSSWNKKSRKF